MGKISWSLVDYGLINMFILYIYVKWLPSGSSVELQKPVKGWPAGNLLGLKKSVFEAAHILS